MLRHGIIVAVFRSSGGTTTGEDVSSTTGTPELRSRPAAEAAAGTGRAGGGVGGMSAARATVADRFRPRGPRVMREILTDEEDWSDVD